MLLSRSLFVCGIPLIASIAQASDWPQWRGTTRTAAISDAAAWPDNLDGLERLWRTELGPSFSGPIVSADRVFTTETREETTEVASARRRDTGELIWERSWEGSLKVPFFAASHGSWIRSTPATDGEFLYVGGMRDVLICLAVDDGAERWRVDFPQRHDTTIPTFGFVSSPLIDDEAIYVQAGGSVVRLDKVSGAIRWRTLIDGGGMLGSAFSSPIIAELSNVRQLVVQTRTELCGVALDTGELLWSTVVPNFRGMNILTPLIVGDCVFTSSYRNGSYLYRPRLENGAWDVEPVREFKPMGYMSSPVLIDGFIYLHLQNRRFSCLSPYDGTERWRTSSFGEYWSKVANGRKILALDSKGDLLLIEADPSEFKLLARRSAAEGDSYGHLAVAGEQLFIRETRALSGWRWRHSGAGRAAP